MDVTVMLPAPDLGAPWKIESFGGARVIRLLTPRTKDIGYLRRSFAELAMPFAMLLRLKSSPLAGERWDGIAWYSPSIFLAPLVSVLKRASRCRGYLIIRDIFSRLGC